MPRTIDMTPTWTDIYRVFIGVLENPDAGYEGRSAAYSELASMADAADKWNAHCKRMSGNHYGDSAAHPDDQIAAAMQMLEYLSGAEPDNHSQMNVWARKLTDLTERADND